MYWGAKDAATGQTTCKSSACHNAKAAAAAASADLVQDAHDVM
jgi:hypothetical protein